MSESQIGNTTPLGRTLVLTVVAAVALAGAGAFVVGGSPTAADWSPHPGKEVSCPPTNETTPDNGTEPTNETDNASDDSGYQLVINYTGAWQGTIVTNDTNIPIEGTGDERIDIEADEDERIAATVSKANVTDEPMGVTLLLNGLVIDEQKPVEPTVDNFDDQDDSGATVDEDTEDFDSTSSDPAFASTSDTDSLNETGTGEGWTTFGDENEASAFEDDTVVAADDDPFDDNETVNTSEDSLDSDDTATNDTTANATDANETTNASDDADECAPVNTSQPTNDTTTTTNSSGLAVETDEEAQIVFADQDVTGPSLVVESATVPDSGFVVIHDMSMLQDGDVRGSVVGVSDKLDAQRSEDIEVTLADDITESQTLIAVVYRDTDGDGEFEFENTGEMIDEPYRDDEGAAVGDDAYVTVPGDDTAETDADSDTASTQDTSVFTDTATATATQTATDTTTTFTSTEDSQAAVSGNAEQTTETNAPGFGIGVAIVAMLAGALVAARRS